jgi:hypothetical protein
MEVLKKWLGFILVGIAIGLGIVYFHNLNSNSSKNILTSPNKNAIPTGKTAIVVDKKMVSLEKQVTAVVVSWNGGKSELEYKLDGSGETKKISLDSKKMTIFIPEAQHKNNAVLPLNNGDQNWNSAFCPKDSLTLGNDNNGEIKLVFNTGYRMCGYKGE